MKVIVTTTINPPTKALEKFLNKKEWKMIVVGDLKTPHHHYENIPDLIYLHPDKQHESWKELSEQIGFGCIQRRNFGFLHAYEIGADIIATVDDDNIPNDDWGDNVLVNKSVNVDCFTCKNPLFDPLSVTSHKELWHRGYPWELISTKNDVCYLGKVDLNVDVQAGLWNGDPDIDAVTRIIRNPIVKFENLDPYTSDKMTVFNSQNTFISRRVLPYYMMIPFVGRMDDIWGSYLVQHFTNAKVVFSKASVYQERNVQNLFTNMKNEIIGYENNLDFIKNFKLPENSEKAYRTYMEYFKKEK